MALTSKQAFVLAKGYTDDSIKGIAGALAGKNCTIESCTKANGRTTVVFKWTADNGDVKRTTMIVEDGTPIYVWHSGDSYEYGDLVIYASCFYRCITPNDDEEFDDTKWNEIGSPDGNYDIVQNSELLPTIFTAADRKVYFSIEDGLFYLWNGEEWVLQKPKWNDITGKPTFADVATSGSYNDLEDTPNIPSKTSNLTNDSNFVSDANYVHTDNNYDATAKGIVEGVTTALADKVDKVTGKGLSENDYTDADKTIVSGVSTALDGKVDKITGKGLSTEDYTTAEQTKLSGIEAGAQVNVQSDWNQTNSKADSFIKNKPEIPDAQIQSDWNQSDNTLKDFIKNKPEIPAAQIQSDWNQSNNEAKDFIKNKPTLGTASSKNVAESGNASTTEVVMGNDTRLTDSRNAKDVYSWAKAAAKPTYTASEVGAIASSLKGANNGVAELDSAGKVPASQLPSYVDDVIEGYYYNSKFYEEAAHTTEITPETGKIYVDLSTDVTYRWSGSAYIALSNPDIANDAVTAITTSTAEYPVPAVNELLKVIIGKINKFLDDLKTKKADKVSSATNGDFAGLDANGNLTDSGKKASDFLTSHQTIKQDGVTGATVNRFGTCSTAAGTSTKTVSITTGTFALVEGARVTVKFSNANTADMPMLNVDSTGAHYIYYRGVQVKSGGAPINVLSGTIDFVYDGSNYNIVGTFANAIPSTDTSAKIFLLGATSQSASNADSYSQDTAYVGTDGCLYSDSKKVFTAYYKEGSTTVSTANQAFTVAISDSNISTSSKILSVCTSVKGLNYTDITLASGSCTISFPGVSSAQTVTVGIEWR